MTIFGSRGGLNRAVPVKQSQGTVEDLCVKTAVRPPAIQNLHNSVPCESISEQSTPNGDECPPSPNPSS
jgi:hypothetical protein